jgi:hypothetical protein
MDERNNHVGLGPGHGTAASPFSGDLSASYLALVQKAFAAWAAATGLKFAEVSASAPTDIRVGWSAFNSATSAVLGYTSSPVKAGVFQSGAEMRLEDPALTALFTDARAHRSRQPTTGPGVVFGPPP